jgi:hypothetical protein
MSSDAPQPTEEEVLAEISSWKSEKRSDLWEALKLIDMRLERAETQLAKGREKKIVTGRACELLAALRKELRLVIDAC